MIPIKDNNDVACFMVTKHSWKGKYKRIFSVGTVGISTYNPDKLEVTNRWPYCDVLSIQPTSKQPGASLEFTITVRKDKKIDNMKFSSEHRAHILTEALKFRSQFSERNKEILRFQAYKHHWSDIRLPVVLEVTQCSLDQLDPATNLVLASYCFKDIEGIIDVHDYPGGFVVACGGFSRLHLFIAPNHGEIKQKVLESATAYLGINIKMLANKIDLELVQSQRFGKYSGDDHQTSVSEFVVQKFSPRHSEPPRRCLCLTETCLLERDPQTYSVVTLRPLSDVFALVRDPINPQLFSIEYLTGHVRTYTANDRDALLASLLDGVRAAGNRDVHIRMTFTPRGKRMGPLHLQVEEEVEANQLKLLLSSPGKRSEALERFNANVPYSGLVYSVTQDGLFTENKERLIISALQSLVQKDADTNSVSSSELEALFHALRRLVASKVGFAAFTMIPGFREAVGVCVVGALRRNDAGVTHAAIDMVCALMHPMHDNYDLRQEQLNKSSLLQTKAFLDSLLDMWTNHVALGTGALVVSAMLDLLTFALCVPYSETTEGKHFDQLLEMVASRGRSLFRLFQHPSTAIVKGAGLVMRALIEEGSADVAARMQSLALAEGVLPRHLLSALYTKPADGRSLTHRQLSRHLVGLWISGHPVAMGLLKRILPAGLLIFLDSTEKIPASALEEERLNNRDNLQIAQEHANKHRKGQQWVAIERQLKHMEKQLEHYTNLALEHWGARVGITIERKEKLRERPIVLRKRRERIKAEANWPMFYWKFGQDHALPNLIWNHKTREELRNALENELRQFSSDRDLAGSALIAWNHAEFEINYQSLADEVRIGDYYLRLLLETEDSPDSPIRRSYEFFNDLYHRFLCSNKIEMKCMCLQAMAIVYGRYYEDIGPFSDTKYIIQLLDRCTDRAERDRLVMFINKLILNQRNVRELLDANGIRILVDLITLAHLHTTRAMIPTQTNVIEAGPDMLKIQEKEWYYNIETDGNVVRQGPVSYLEMKELWNAEKVTHKTRCWAMGMDGWRSLQQIPQLKWCLVAKGTQVLNESELATLILDVLIQCCSYFPSRDADEAIIRPIPRVKRFLAEPLSLSHVVQLLLTFDPVLVERVATLLCEVIQDNPEISKLYLTGVFFFILMYTGSNVLPIARFLQLTHMKQAFRSEDTACSDIMQRSILGQLLPEAMVSYLENHGAVKFAEIFLGEFDTPEAIWNTEMRRMLIEKVAAHIADFSPRLRSHTMARYPYVAIPVVRYPQLDRELFCNIFYLRHLCDTKKFPAWPIPDPVKLLKDVLDAWKKEVEKKPPLMTIDEAYRDLGLELSDNPDEATLRKAYYRLAQKFHPDKNPNGRDRFEQVNQAYEFLCSRSVWAGDGPNPDNIVLVLKTQSILFHRYSEELQPYKYAGYPQLIITIQLETADDQLFSKSAPLLTAACELCYHTVQCSALNAEELRREGGLDVLLEAYSRCVSVLNHSSKPTDVSVQVCANITRCYTVAARFQQCRHKMVEMVQLVQNLCRILNFKHLPKLCSIATECVGALALDGILQMQMFQAGALWHLLLFMFNYDFTLEEGGVERSEDANQQEVSNRLAKLAVRACAQLGGYMKGELETPSNVITKTALNTLLTPYLANQLENETSEDLLKTLNSNSCIPYLIWDNGTRAELTDFLETQRQSRAQPDDDMDYVSSFEFTAHKDELIIGGIFVRIYNEQPTFPISNPKGFTVELIDFLNRQHQQLGSLHTTTITSTTTTILKHIVMSLEALASVIRNNPGVEIQCIGHFRLLFNLLSMSRVKPIQRGVLEVISIVTRNQECVNDIAASEVLGHMLIALLLLPDCQVTCLETMNSLLSTPKLVKEALAKGAVLYLLDLFCNSNVPQVRELTAELLARMGADKLNGPKVRLALGRFLPAVFADAMRDSPEACVHMFETTHEHPELIWDQDARDRVSQMVAEMRDTHFKSQQINPHVTWKLPDTNTMSSAANPSEVVVGGVYLRLFISNPGWTLRKPKEFLSELMDACLGLMGRNQSEADYLEMSTTALCALLSAQPALTDGIPALGHIPRLFRQMPLQPKSTILVLHQLALSEVCIGAICQTECMHPLKKAMQSKREMVGVACEALNRIFSTNQDQLVKQALDTDMVQYLLSLLGNRLEVIENPSMTKAQIVGALKAMSHSLMWGDKVSALLDANPVWAEYKDQRHDLFISSTPITGYLTGGTPTTAGYLTQGPTKGISTAPPPPDKDDPLARSSDII